MSESLQKEQVSIETSSQISVNKFTCVLCNKKINNLNEIHMCLIREKSKIVRVYLN
jgi:predicted ATPase